MFRTTAVFLLFLATVQTSQAQAWRAMTDDLIQREKPGFGKLCGVAVDHATGEVFVNLSDKALFRSKDRGETWERVGDLFKGRTETPGCLQFDPRGGTNLVAALVYGGPILTSSDRGEKWKALDKKSMHVDWCAVDWSDPNLGFILTLKHESGDLLLASHNGGKTFEEVGKGYGPAWIFDAHTAVVAQAKSKTNAKPGILRTTDAGKTFQPCGDYHARALPRWKDDTLYWLVDGSLIRTTDKGFSWQKVNDVKDGRFGPIFGKSAQHLFVLAGNGILESADGGKSWEKPIAVPKEMKGVSSLSWLEFDPVHNSLYVMKMGSDLFRLERTK